MTTTTKVHHVSLSASSQYHLDRLDRPAIHSPYHHGRCQAPLSVSAPEASPPQNDLTRLADMPKETQDEILRLAANSNPRRIWIRFAKHPGPCDDPLRLIYCSRSPLPLQYLLDKKTKRLAQKLDGYVEVKSSQDDPCGVIFSLEYDMVFIDSFNYSVPHIGDELRKFKYELATTHGAAAISQLKCIAVNYHFVKHAGNSTVREENWRLLREISGLELVYWSAVTFLSRIF